MHNNLIFLNLMLCNKNNNSDNENNTIKIYSQSYLTVSDFLVLKYKNKKIDCLLKQNFRKIQDFLDQHECLSQFMYIYNKDTVIFNTFNRLKIVF